jgi:CRP-like cAMP-binding protein
MLLRLAVTTLFVLALKIIITGLDNVYVKLTYLGSGDYFGEFALICGVPRTANVRCLGTVEVLCLSRENFVESGAVILSFYLRPFSSSCHV